VGPELWAGRCKKKKDQPRRFEKPVRSSGRNRISCFPEGRGEFERMGKEGLIAFQYYKMNSNKRLPKPKMLIRVTREGPRGIVIDGGRKFRSKKNRGADVHKLRHE